MLMSSPSPLLLPPPPPLPSPPPDRRFTELMTDKQLVLDTVHKLPDDTPLEKISEEIEFLMAVQQGLKALDEGRVVSHEDVKARVASWRIADENRVSVISVKT